MRLPAAMRTPKVCQISEREYESTLWPELSNIVQGVLEGAGTVDIPQEELYRKVYNVCLTRHSQRLYTDLCLLLSENLTKLAQKLQSVEDDNFVLALARSLRDYQKALSVIAVGFKYLQRTFVMPKYNRPLTEILMGLFFELVVSSPRLLNRLQVLLPVFDPIRDPASARALVCSLYAWDEKSATLSFPLFELYIPCLVQTTDVEKERASVSHYLGSPPHPCTSSPGMGSSQASKREREWEHCRL